MDIPRKVKYQEALASVIEPGDVVLVVCKDDSRTLLYGKDYRDAYASHQWTPEHTFPGVLLGFKLLGELMAGHMAVCLPGEKTDMMQLQMTEKQFDDFKAAMAAGTLQPADSFPLVANAYREMALVLEGHMAACMPNQYRQMQEALKNPPTQRLYGADGTLIRGGRPS